MSRLQKQNRAIEWFFSKESEAEVWFCSFMYFSHTIPLLIFWNLLSQFDTFAPMIVTYEKYTYYFTFAWFLLYQLVYFIRNRTLPLNRCHLFMIVYFAVAVISTYYNSGRSLSFDKAMLYELFMTAVYMFSCPSRMSKEQFKKMIRICGIVYISLIALINVLSFYCLLFPVTDNMIHLFGIEVRIPQRTLLDRTWIKTVSYTGFYWNSSVLGMECSSAILMSVYLYKEKSISLINLLLSVILAMILIFLSVNRTALIMLALVMLFSLMEWLHETKNTPYSKTILLTLLATSVICAIVIILKWSSATSVFETVTNDPYAVLDVFSSGRILFLYSAAQMVKESPILGKGWNVTIGGHTSFHNYIGDVLAKTGLLGFMIFVLFSTSVTNKIRKVSFQLNYWLICIVICYSIEGLLDMVVFCNSRKSCTYFFWLILGFLVSDQAPRKEACEVK